MEETGAVGGLGQVEMFNEATTKSQGNTDRVIVPENKHDVDVVGQERRKASVLLVVLHYCRVKVVVRRMTAREGNRSSHQADEKERAHSRS